MGETLDTCKLLAALKFSADKHRRQKRKDGESPYINHPIDVSEILVRIAGVRDTETIVAALLHDTVEDTHTTEDELTRHFGADICSLVMECTDDKSLPKAERKRLQIVNASHKSPRARLIKIADKICNVLDVSNTPPADWTLERRRDYLNWASQVVAGLRGGNAELDALFDLSLAEAKDKLDAQAASSV